MASYSAGQQLEGLCRDPLRPDVGPQDFRNDHAPVRLLVILYNRHPSAAYGQPASVQRVHEFRFVLALWTVSNIGTPRLVRLKIRAGRNLTKQLLPGQPDFKVIGLR